MKVTCAQCLSVYNIPEEKLRKEVSRTTCRKCGNRIQIRRPVGIPKLHTQTPMFEHIPPPPINFMDQAVPKRLNDDERTHLDESRVTTPRPETNTNLAFGPSVSAVVEEEEEPGFSEHIPTAPSIQTIQTQKEEEELVYSLDWICVFGLNLLSIVGVCLVAIFRTGDLFVLMLGVVLFGSLSSLLLVLTSRFGRRDGSIYTSLIFSFFLSIFLGALYFLYFQNLIDVARSS